LDKDTSGALLVAKTEQALRALMADFKNRSIRKIYHALLIRCPQENEGRVAAPIGRHPVDRKKMAVREDQGRFAATNWRILERFANGWCLAEIDIETGRTHQIRVHMASIKVPVVADPLYGGAVHRSSSVRPTRQMLHANTLRFCHPLSGEEVCCMAPWYEDMQTIVDVLRGMVA
jgi:23S rRNA pseudouridine1911/1915/1917 synthase